MYLFVPLQAMPKESRMISAGSLTPQKQLVIVYSTVPANCKSTSKMATIRTKESRQCPFSCRIVLISWLDRTCVFGRLQSMNEKHSLKLLQCLLGDIQHLDFLVHDLIRKEVGYPCGNIQHVCHVSWHPFPKFPNHVPHADFQVASEVVTLQGSCLVTYQQRKHAALVAAHFQSDLYSPTISLSMI
jgi:hypothetical protein